MSDTQTDKSQLVVATANRLRMIQTDLAETSPEIRQQYLSDELERGLANVVPAERAAFLDELQTLFPTWEPRIDRRKNGDGSSGESASDRRELDDPSFLVQRLAELAPSMSDADRRAAAARLRDAGLGAEGRQVWPEQAAQKLRVHLKLPENAEIDPLRSMELLHWMTDLVNSLDQIVWSTWKAVSPRSDIRGAGEVRKTLPAYLSGDANLSRADALQQVERLRQMTAAMISAISQAGYQYAQQHYTRFAPDRIEAVARQDKKTLESAGVACWRKYCELFGTADQATIERDIMQLIGEYAERLMKGLAR